MRTPHPAHTQGWQGMQTLPREITLDPHAGTLLVQPIREVQRLRKELLMTSNTTISSTEQVCWYTCLGVHVWVYTCMRVHV